MSTSLALSSSLESLDTARADEVHGQIMTLKSGLARHFLTLARLLKEARDNSYNLVWGFPRFDDWVEEASGLDMSARNAYYLIGVVEMGDRLCLPDSELEKVKFSKLKAIAALKDGEMSDEDKRELITAAETMTLKDISEVVAVAKQQEWVHRTYKFDKSGYDNVIAPGIERVKRVYGNTLSESGENADVSDSKAVEIAFAEYAAGPEQDEDFETFAEFEDEFEFETLPQAAEEDSA
jgi:hypothetical protein